MKENIGRQYNSIHFFLNKWKIQEEQDPELNYKLSEVIRVMHMLDRHTTFEYCNVKDFYNELNEWLTTPEKREE